MFAKEGYAGEVERKDDDFLGEGYANEEEEFDEGNRDDNEDEGDELKTKMIELLRSDGFEDHEIDLIHTQLLSNECVISGAYVYQAVLGKKWKTDLIIVFRNGLEDLINILQDLGYDRGRHSYEKANRPNIKTMYNGNPVEELIDESFTINVFRFFYDGKTIKSSEYIDPSILKMVNVVSLDQWVPNIKQIIPIKDALRNEINIDYVSIFDSFASIAQHTS